MSFMVFKKFNSLVDKSKNRSIFFKLCNFIYKSSNANDILLMKIFQIYSKKYKKKLF